MTADQIRFVVYGLVFATCLASAAAAGWTVNGWRKDADIAELKKEQAESSAKAATEAQKKLKAAQARGDALHNQLAAAEAAIETQQEVSKREIKRLTTGQPCLSGAAVRVLNQPGLRLGAVPTPAGQPVATDAASATDTDLGLWIATSIGQYSECRERLQALIDWHSEGSVASMAPSTNLAKPSRSDL